MGAYCKSCKFYKISIKTQEISSFSVQFSNMKSLLTLLLLCCLHTTYAIENERALIVVIDLAEKATNHKKMYINETTKAVKRIKKITAGYYSKLIILHRKIATKKYDLEQLEKLAQDDSVKVIDSIIYVHGKNEFYKNGPSLCFVDGESCVNVQELATQINSIPGLQQKLRALYSDACWGEYHLNSWIDAGFKIASGSKGVDSNRSIDLKRFLKKWISGESFKTSIDHANSSFISDIMDEVIKNGNSHKEILGNELLTIQSEI